LLQTHARIAFGYPNNQPWSTTIQFNHDCKTVFVRYVLNRQKQLKLHSELALDACTMGVLELCGLNNTIVYITLNENKKQSSSLQWFGNFG